MQFTKHLFKVPSKSCVTGTDTDFLVSSFSSFFSSNPSFMRLATSSPKREATSLLLKISFVPELISPTNSSEFFFRLFVPYHFDLCRVDHPKQTYPVLGYTIFANALINSFADSLVRHTEMVPSSAISPVSKFPISKIGSSICTPSSFA